MSRGTRLLMQNKKKRAALENVSSAPWSSLRAGAGLGRAVRHLAVRRRRQVHLAIQIVLINIMDNLVGDATNKG